VLSSIVEMVQRKQRPDGETLYIDESDRQQILELMRSTKPRMTQARLADECGVTASAISLLLKHPIPRGETRGCKFLPKLQGALGLIKTTKIAAVIPNRDARPRVLRVMKVLDRDEFENWIRNGELLAGKR